VECVNTWDTRRTIGAIAVAAAIAGVGGAAIAAATDTGFHAVSGGMHGDGHQPAFPASHRVDDGTDSLHGENVVADGHGGFTTLLSQTGLVTAISATSVTARSDDGFVQTYLIHQVDPAAQPPFHIHDQVTINARREGETAVLSTIRPPLAPGH
jgi:hypothetical protein